MSTSVKFDDIPWEIKMKIFRLTQNKSNLVKVSKEWRNLVWKQGKKRDEFIGMYINQLVRKGHLALLKWLSTQIDITDYWDKWACAYAAERGHLDVLKWLRDPSVHNTDRGVCPWDELTCTEAAGGGDLDMLKWLRDPAEHPDGVCPWDGLTCNYAAGGGHLDMLKWLRDPAEHPDGVCPLFWNIGSAAGLAGHLDVLKWLRENGYSELY